MATSAAESHRAPFPADGSLVPLVPERRDYHEVFRILEMLILVVAGVFVVLGTYAQSFGDTANSRLATVYSLTEYGTWFIDRPLDEEPIRFEQRTIDKVVLDGRTLSSKPPMLPLFMTVEYLALNALFGLHLDSPEDTSEIIRWLSMTLIGIPYLLGLVFFVKTLRMFHIDPLARLVLLIGLAFGTQWWGYATNINNHVPAAGLLVVALYLALGLAEGKVDARPWRFFLFGFVGALVPTIDMPAGIFVLAAGIYLVLKLPRLTLIWVPLGMILPLAVHFGIMIGVTGSPVPVQTRWDELYLSESSYWRNPRGIDALNEPKLNYFFHMTFGRVGLFSLFPITFLGFIAGVLAVLRREFPYRVMLLGGLAAFVILTLYYLTGTNNYGGEAFGFRWYIVAMPVLLLMAAPWLAQFRSRGAWLVVAFLLGVSFYSAWQCSYMPWGSNNEWTVRFLGRSY